MSVCKKRWESGEEDDEEEVDVDVVGGGEILYKNEVKTNEDDEEQMPWNGKCI